MGYANHELVPAAILLDNPGISKEEFVQLLDNTQCYSGEVSKSICMDLRNIRPKPWTAVPPSYGGDPDTQGWWDKYHKGLWGLGEILNLPSTSAFEKAMEAEIAPDAFGLYAGMTTVYIHARPVKGGWEPYADEWHLHPATATDNLRFGRWTTQRQYRQGEVETSLYIKNSPFDAFIVERLVKVRVKNYDYEHTMLLRQLRRPLETKIVAIDELVSNHPQFRPDILFDFSKPSGVLYPARGYVWKQENGRYSLDEKTFSNIGAGDIHGYSALVLTAEAIRTKSWKLLTRCGLQHRNEFLKKNPQSVTRFERAIWDAQTSLYARNLQMSTKDFLRARLQRFSL